MKKLLGISYFSYICLFWVRDPNLLTESAGTVLPVSLSSVSSFSWLLKICLSHWNLSRHFSHIKGVLASENTERFPNSWVTLRHFSQKNKQKKVISMAVRIPSQKLRAQEREKFQILNESAVLWSSWHHSHSACSKSETQRAPCSLIVTSTLPPPQISCTLRLGSNKGSGRNYTYQLENSHCVRNTINPGAMGQDTNSCCRERGIGWKPLTDPKLVN